MRTELDCLVCFMQQALATARFTGADALVQSEVVAEIGRLLPQLDRSISPPENAVVVYARIAEITGVQDPYGEVKAQSNRLALELRDEARARIAAAGDPLYAALRHAIAANIIDYGTQRVFDARHSLATCLERSLALDDYDRFREMATAGRDVLYLADNCGEIVFDGLLIEQLLARGCRVTLAVRGQQILNDATMADAQACGLDGLCPVISNGTGCPGTTLAACSDELRAAYDRAGLIVSKGQGNFETMAEADRRVFFLLTVKCPVVAGRIAAEKGLPPGRLTGRGEMILMQGK